MNCPFYVMFTIISQCVVFFADLHSIVWCLHAVSSRQHPAALDENSSTRVCEALVGVLWFHLQGHLPGYSPGRDLQTPKDSGHFLFRLSLPAGGELLRSRGGGRDESLSWCRISCWSLGGVLRVYRDDLRCFRLGGGVCRDDDSWDDVCWDDVCWRLT